MMAIDTDAWPAVIIMRLEARLDSADPELTCFICRGPRCEYGWTVMVGGARLTHGVHRSCAQKMQEGGR